MIDLRGKVVIITGAGGIGSETARAFAGVGCRVAVCDRLEDRLDSALERLQGTPGEVFMMVADVSDELQVRSFVEATVERWGRMDVLVNNAGYGLHKPFLKTSVDEIQAQLQTNYMGVVHATKAALAHMVPARRGHIVNVVSVVAKLPVPNSGNYAATRAALDALSLTRRAEVREEGVRGAGGGPAAVR